MKPKIIFHDTALYPHLSGISVDVTTYPPLRTYLESVTVITLRIWTHDNNLIDRQNLVFYNQDDARSIRYAIEAFDNAVAKYGPTMPTYKEKAAV